MDTIAVSETDLYLGGVDVDIDLVRRNTDKNEDNGLAINFEHGTVGFANRVIDEAIANKSAVEEDVLPLAAGSCRLGWGD